jgi:hypothetical protein
VHWSRAALASSSFFFKLLWREERNEMLTAAIYLKKAKDELWYENNPSIPINALAVQLCMIRSRSAS